MSAPNITLYKPNILVQESASVLGISSLENPLSFGTVINVYATCDLTEVGASVMFDPLMGIKLVSNGDIYILIKETNLYFSEIAPS